MALLYVSLFLSAYGAMKVDPSDPTVQIQLKTYEIGLIFADLPIEKYKM